MEIESQDYPLADVNLVDNELTSISVQEVESSSTVSHIAKVKYRLVLCYSGKPAEAAIRKNQLYLYYTDSKLEYAVINHAGEIEFFSFSREQFGNDLVTRKSFDAFKSLLLDAKQNLVCRRKDKSVLERITARHGHPLRPEIVSYKAATVEVVGQVVPFTAGRLLNGINTLLNGVVTGSLGANAIAANPIVSALSATTLGFARGPSAVVGLLMSRKLASEYGLRLTYTQQPLDDELQARILYLYYQNDSLCCSLIGFDGAPTHLTISSEFISDSDFDAIKKVLLSGESEDTQQGLDITNESEIALSHALLSAHGYALKNSSRPDMGGLVLDGWIAGLISGVPIMALFVASGKITGWLGVSTGVADAVGAYLKPLSLAVLPFLWGFTDQQFALGIRESKLTFVLGVGYAAISMGVGYPLALGLFGLPKVGFAGMAWGITASGWINLVGLRTYFALRKDKFGRYHLFTPYFKGSRKNLMALLRMGIPLGLQPLVDWSNLTAISFLLGIISTEALTASAPSMQVLLLYTFFIQSVALGTGILVTGDVDLAHSDPHHVWIHNENARRISHAGAGIGFLFSGLLWGGCVVFEKQICELFTYSERSEEGYDVMLQQAQAMLLINGIALLLEPFRNIYGGALRGLKDVWFAPMVSFITMSLIGLSAGGGLSVFLDWGAGWLFMTRDVGILLAALAIVHRWLSKTSVEIPELQRYQELETSGEQEEQARISNFSDVSSEQTRSSANHRNSFFSCIPCLPYFSSNDKTLVKTEEVSNEKKPLLSMRKSFHTE